MCRALRDQLGPDAVFMDTSSIATGSSWPESLERTTTGVELVVAVIGPNWVRASDEWGRRRIDSQEDWVRRKIETDLDIGTRVIPVLVDGVRMPPRSVLPETLQGLVEKQTIELRRDYWDHDILILMAQLDIGTPGQPSSTSKDIDPYPKQAPEPPGPLDDEKIDRVLSAELVDWKKIASSLPGEDGNVRIKLTRQYKFATFIDAIAFMSQVAPGCDIAMHHPRCENIWKTLSVYLSTWDHDLHKIKDRDITLAKYFDRAHTEFIERRQKQVLTTQSPKLITSIIRYTRLTGREE